jgi:hypothetical protein
MSLAEKSVIGSTYHSIGHAIQQYLHMRDEGPNRAKDWMA